MTENDFEEHAKNLACAIGCLFERDRDLLEININERTTSSRLAYYLTDKYEPLLKVDCEYNSDKRTPLY